MKLVIILGHLSIFLFSAEKKNSHDIARKKETVHVPSQYAREIGNKCVGKTTRFAILLK